MLSDLRESGCIRKILIEQILDQHWNITNVIMKQNPRI